MWGWGGGGGLLIHFHGRGGNSVKIGFAPIWKGCLSFKEIISSLWANYFLFFFKVLFRSFFFKWTCSKREVTKVDPALNVEMILRWTINVRPMEGEDTTWYIFKVGKVTLSRLVSLLSEKGVFPSRKLLAHFGQILSFFFFLSEHVANGKSQKLTLPSILRWFWDEW